MSQTHRYMSWTTMGEAGQYPPTCRRGLPNSPTLTPCTFEEHLDHISMMQKHERRHWLGGTQLGQPWATSSHGGHHAGRSGGKPPHPFSSLQPSKVQVRKDTQSCHEHLHRHKQGALHHHHHQTPARLWLSWVNSSLPACAIAATFSPDGGGSKAVSHCLRAGQGTAADAWQGTCQTSPSLVLKFMALLLSPVPVLTLLSLSRDTNHAFTVKATQPADVEL